MSKADVERIANRPDEHCADLEAQLRDKLYEIVESLKRLMAHSPSMQTPSTPSLMYDGEVMNILRSFIQSGWMAGTIHTTSRLKHEAYLTHTDVTRIKEIALNHSNRFWARVERGVTQKEMEARFMPAAEDTPTDKRDEAEHYSNEWICDAIASSCIYTAYNQAIKEKAIKL
jgi:hypothetical protein